jgi:hypothetical protein
MTPMIEGLPENIQKDLASTILLPKRLGKPEEFAKLVQSIIQNPLLNGELTVLLNSCLYYNHCYQLLFIIMNITIIIIAITCIIIIFIITTDSYYCYCYTSGEVIRLDGGLRMQP